MPVYPNDMLTSRFLTGAIERRPTKEAIKQSYIGEKYFPMREVPERKLQWDIMYSENNLAGIYDPKGQAIPIEPILFRSSFASLIDVKSSMMLDPDEIQMIRSPGSLAVYRASEGNPYMQAKMNKEKEHIFKRTAMVDDMVDAMLEYMRIQFLTTGAMIWPPVDGNGSAIGNAMPNWNAEMPVSIVLPMQSVFKQKASTLVGWNGRVNSAGQLAWTAAASDPIQDLEIISELYLKTTGTSLRGGTILMSEILLSQLAFKTSILQWIAGTNREQPDARKYADVMEVKSFIKTRTGWNIETYDAQWTYRQKVAGDVPIINRVPFMDDGTVVLLPPGAENGGIGYMATAFQRWRDGSYKSGKYPWTHEAAKPPHELEIGENIVAFPVVEQYDWVIIKADE